MNLTYLSELQEAYMNNLLIPVIGCGLSVPFHLPDWKTLIVEAADMFELTDTDRQIMNQYLAVNDYLDAIDVLIDAGGDGIATAGFCFKKDDRSKERCGCIINR